MSRSDDLALIESGMLCANGTNNTVIRANKILAPQDTGFVLVDASAGQLKVTLPPANRPMDVRIQRVDNTASRLLVYAANGERIKFHTHLRAEGYPFCIVLGSGDFWHLRSDSVGSWVLIDRLDKTPPGRLVFDTSLALNPGGWGVADGTLRGRNDFPWLWDHAQQSGMLVIESERAGMEGGWTSGDESINFRIPEIRGDFLRVLDEGRGIDAQRKAGSFQKGSLQTFDPNNASPSVSGLWHGTTLDAQARSYHGLDPLTEDVLPSYSIFAGGSGGVVNSGLGVVRPRNTAFPARIKLI